MAKNNKGFTLVELLIAVAILAAVIGPYFTQFVTSTKIGERSERIVRAEFIAQRILEEEKRSSLKPELGNSRTIEEDGFDIVITYFDESNNVNNPSNSLDLYSNDVTTRYVIRPDIQDTNLNVDINIDGGATLLPISSLGFGSELKLELKSTSVTNQYILSYSENGGPSVTLDTFSLMSQEDASFRFNGQTNGTTDTLLNFVISNKTFGTDDERKIVVYEFDDTKRNFNFKTDTSSTGDVELYLKLSSAETSSTTNDLDYYWIQIDVQDSTGTTVTELYSAIRKE